LKSIRFLISTAAAAAATWLFGTSRVPGLAAIDWFLLAVAYQAASGSFAAATLGGAAAGLLEDILIHPLKGANAFAKALIGYVLTAISLRVVFAGALVVAISLAVAALLNTLIVGGLGRLLIGTPFLLGFSDLGRCALTGGTGGILYWAWRFPWKEEWRRRRRQRLR
jgi:rod shape-determining protein MreD